MPRADRGAAEAVARHQHHATDSGGGRGAAGFGHSGNPERGMAGAFLKHGHRRHLWIEQIKIGTGSRQ